MVNKELLKEIETANIEINNAWDTISRLTEHIKNLNEEICKNITMDDLRPMTKEDIKVGQRFFGENSDGFYTLVIDEILDYGDLDFKAFVADGCRYGIYEHYVIKD